jgi:uridine kinase
MTEKKDILEVYKEKRGQLIILISGLSGSGKTALGKNISRDFRMKLIDTQEYYKHDYDAKVKLPNGKEILNYDTDEIVDWGKLSDDVNNAKKDGVVVTGNAFPKEKLDFTPDYHIHLKISKQYLKQKRLEYIEKHKELKTDPETETLRVNIYTYPYYLNVIERMKIDKTIYTPEKTEGQIYDEIFEEIIKFIKSNVYDKSSREKSKDKSRDKHEVLEPTTQQHDPISEYNFSITSDEDN